VIRASATWVLTTSAANISRNGWTESLLVGSLPGIFLGSYLSGRVAELALRIILALTLAVVGSKLAVERIQNQLAAVVSSPNQ
jgi:uncharacterized membrane protein YfcA